MRRAGLLKVNGLKSCGTQNQAGREAWLEKTLQCVPAGSRILDAGAGELQYKRFCAHLKYVSQDFAQYDGQGDGTGLQTGAWQNDRLDIISDITQIPEPDASLRLSYVWKCWSTCLRHWTPWVNSADY